MTRTAIIMEYLDREAGQKHGRSRTDICRSIASDAGLPYGDVWGIMCQHWDAGGRE